jgi:hypothetical protein
MRNEKAQTRPLDNPYETYKSGDWEWKVLKHYQSPENEAKNKYARVFCAVKSPFTYGSYEYGDVYLRDIPKGEIMPNKVKIYVDSIGMNRVLKCGCDFPKRLNPYTYDLREHPNYEPMFADAGNYKGLCRKCRYYPWYLVRKK